MDGRGLRRRTVFDGRKQPPRCLQLINNSHVLEARRHCGVKARTLETEEGVGCRSLTWRSLHDEFWRVVLSSPILLLEIGPLTRELLLEILEPYRHAIMMALLRLRMRAWRWDHSFGAASDAIFTTSTLSSPDCRAILTLSWSGVGLISKQIMTRPGRVDSIVCWSSFSPHQIRPWDRRDSLVAIPPMTYQQNQPLQ